MLNLRENNHHDLKKVLQVTIKIKTKTLQQGIMILKIYNQSNTENLKDIHSNLTN